MLAVDEHHGTRNNLFGDERRNHVNSLDKLISEAKQKGWVTYKELVDVLPDDMIDLHDVEQLIARLDDAGIKLVEYATDARDFAAYV